MITRVVFLSYANNEVNVVQSCKLSDDKVYDALIIGGGIGGILTLKQFKETGISAILLEKNTQTGGLWSRLPRWQDLQVRKEDWSINNQPIASEGQTSVLKNINSWVASYNLSNAIKTSCEVLSTKRLENCWQVETSRGVFLAKHLVAATGAHNKPVIPNITRNQSTINESHSSKFKDPKSLAGKSVAIVGGRASAMDLIDLAIEHGAKEIHWIYRRNDWMIPTLKRKHESCHLRFLALMQMLGVSNKRIGRHIEKAIIKSYKKFGLEDILPDYKYDYTTQTLIPGRPLMIKHFDKIKRYKTEVASAESNQIKLASGENIEVDELLWATGYSLDMTFLDLPEIKDIKDADQLRVRCGSNFVSLDYPNLYFFGMLYLDGIGSTPFMYSVLAKTLAAHIKGDCEISSNTQKQQVHHWANLSKIAQYDKNNFSALWRLKYLFKSVKYSIKRNDSITV